MTHGLNQSITAQSASLCYCLGSWTALDRGRSATLCNCVFVRACLCARRSPAAVRPDGKPRPDCMREPVCVRACACARACVSACVCVRASLRARVLSESVQRGQRFIPSGATIHTVGVKVTHSGRQRSGVWQDGGFVGVGTACSLLRSVSTRTWMLLMSPETAASSLLRRAHRLNGARFALPYATAPNQRVQRGDHPSP